MTKIKILQYFTQTFLCLFTFMIMTALPTKGQFITNTSGKPNHTHIDSLVYQLNTEKDPKLKAKLYIAIVTHYGNENLDSATVYVSKGLDFAQKVGNEALEASLHYSLACIRQSQSRYIEALSNLAESYRLNKQIGCKDTTITLHVMALAYAQMHNFGKAQNYFDRAEKALKLKNLTDTLELCNQLANRASIYVDMKELEKASISMLKAKSLIVPYKHLYDFRIGLCIRAINVLVKKQEFEAAELELKEALASAENEPQATAPSSVLWYWQAYFSFHHKSYTQALAQLNKAATLALESQQVSQITNCYLLFSDIYVAMGEHKQAYHYLQKEQRIMDSLHSDFALERMIILKDSMNYAQVLLKDTEIKNAQKSNRLIVALSGSILAIILILLYLFRRMMVQRQTLKELDYQANLAAKNKENLGLQTQLNEQLNELVVEKTKALEASFKEVEDLKNRENSSLALHNHQYQLLIDNLSGLIEEWVQKSNLAESSQLKKIRLELKQRQHKNQNWDSFILHFEQVNPLFYQILQQKYPQLTPNDLKHCAYIKLNMSRKEVADLMGISDEAVRMARNRLKKKLEIDSKGSLREFLAEIGNEN